MKAVVAAFNQEKALVGAFSVITNLRMELFEALDSGLSSASASASSSCSVGGAARGRRQPPDSGKRGAVLSLLDPAAIRGRRGRGRGRPLSWHGPGQFWLIFPFSSDGINKYIFFVQVLTLRVTTSR